MSQQLTIRLRKPHPAQMLFVNDEVKRKVVRAGRRGGKTIGVATLAVQRFLAGRRQLYATPTGDQITSFWFEVKRALDEPIRAGIFIKNESERIIERPGTLQRIRAKTAWNADSLRGDYADDLYLDEYQLMNEDAWATVGAPMMLDTNGNAVFLYTPPSLHSGSMTKAKDKMHAAKLFKRAAANTTGRWKTYHFSSYDNPYLSVEALNDISSDMSARAIQQEIMALDLDDDPNALWTREIIESTRVLRAPGFKRIIVAVDPPASADSGTECGITVHGLGFDDHGYLIRDASTTGTPEQWASAAVKEYYLWEADRLIAEVNNGGDMVERVIRIIDPDISFKAVHASRSKQTRAEPVMALYEKGRYHHVGEFPELEAQLCTWVPGEKSPDRLDSLVWGGTELLIDAPGEMMVGISPMTGYRG